MTDLKTRFRGADRIPAPHLWQEITNREPSPHRSEPSAARRILVAAFAMAIAVAGVSFTIHAFRGGQPRPTPGTVAHSIEPKGNGLISFQVGGSEGGIWTDTIQPDGSGRQTIFGRDQNVSRVVWSPDGSQVAYVQLVQGSSQSPDGKPHWGIFTANPDGTNAHELSSGVNDSWPAWLTWSPDGSRIAFSNLPEGSDAHSCIPGGDATCPTEIYVMNADGTNVSQLTTDATGAYQPSWSPDGTHIAFVRQAQPSDGGTAIFVMNADGSDVRNIASTTQGSDFAPSWSPDGSQVMYGSIRGEDWGIFVVNADGTGERSILDKGPYVDDPVWSPDGTMVAFVGDAGISGTGGGSALYIMRADGTGITKLADTPHHDVNGGIAWQPLTVGSPSPAIRTSVSARVVDRINVGQATSVAYGEGSVWVAVSAANPADRAILRIDPVSDEIIATIPTSVVPGWDNGGGGLLVADGSVWVAGPDASNNGGAGALVRIDPSTNQVTDTIPLNGYVGDVAVDPGGIWALLSGDPEAPEVVRIDPSTDKVVATIPLNGGAGRFIFDEDGAVFAAVAQPPGGPYDSGTLIRIDPSTDQVAGTLELGTYPSAAAGDNAIWAITDTGLVQIAPTTGQPTSAPVHVNCTGDALAVGAGGVWCFDPARNRALERFNSETSQVDVRMRPDQGTGGTSLATSPGSIWVVNGQQLTRIDVG